MSREYDLYLQDHRDGVKKAFEFIRDRIPPLVPVDQELRLTQQICFDHDRSKNNEDEYEPYDEYFYGKNRSYQVIQDYEYAWLLHIHRNPHHWQYWILNRDDPDEAETIMDMPENYILEMICDWWSFSWRSENLYEIFDWYDKNGPYMKLSRKTRKSVEIILEKIRKVLDELDNDKDIEHSGVKGMKWGVKNGPPYPIDHNEVILNTNSSSDRITKIKRVNMAEEKFTQYALNPNKAPDKAHAFEVALGYTLDDYKDLMANISDNFDSRKLEEKGDDGYGMRYQQVMNLNGPNGKTANVCTAWIQEKNGTSVKLTSAYVTKKEVSK